MIVPFAVDPDALAFVAGGDLATHLATHRRVLDTWRRIGVLVHGGDRFAQSELAQTVSDLPQQVKLLWQKALRTHRLLAAGADWTPLSSFTSQAQLSLVRDRFEVGCLEDTRAACLEIPFDKVSVLVEGKGPEICRFSLADQASSFANAVTAAESPIAKDDPVVKIWHERLEPAAQLCTKGVSIIDRYAVVNHLQRPNSGLDRFFVECEKVLRGQTVTLCTAYDDDCSREVVVNAVRKLATGIKTERIRRIGLYVGHQSLFAGEAHYRYVRFDSTICELDIGLGVLAGEKAYAQCKYRLRAATEEDSREETRLRGLMRYEVCPCLNS